MFSGDSAYTISRLSRNFRNTRIDARRLKEPLQRNQPADIICVSKTEKGAHCAEPRSGIWKIFQQEGRIHFQGVVSIFR